MAVDWTKPIQVRTEEGVFPAEVHEVGMTGNASITWEGASGPWWYKPTGDVFGDFHGMPTVENVPEPSPWHDGDHPHSGVAWYVTFDNDETCFVRGYCGVRGWVSILGCSPYYPTAIVGPVVPPHPDWPKLEPIPEELPLPEVRRGWCKLDGKPATFVEQAGRCFIPTPADGPLVFYLSDLQITDIRWEDGAAPEAESPPAENAEPVAEATKPKTISSRDLKHGQRARIVGVGIDRGGACYEAIGSIVERDDSLFGSNYLKVITATDPALNIKALAYEYEVIPLDPPLPRVGWCDVGGETHTFVVHGGWMWTSHNGESLHARCDIDKAEMFGVTNIRYAEEQRQ